MGGRVEILFELKTHRNVARAGEEIAKLVQRERHHAVGRVECLLDAVAVMNVNVNVEHARMVPAHA